jgi:23S rRNA pseudouridine1911/1915/1917 synthase
VPDSLTFQVTVEASQRLDQFIAQQLSISRTQSARLVAAGAVAVNGSTGRAGRRLARGDSVTVVFPEDEPRREITPHPIPLDIVFEDDHILVINKPAGLVVHPAPGHWNDTLVNALAARGTPLAGPSERPGIVHRLDRDTSGLMVVAKTKTAHRSLSRALAARRIERWYAALVWGHVTDRVIDEPLARHPKDRKRMMVMPGGRPARSRVEQVARFDATDLVRVVLETGRTHQIRVHLAHVGHPVVGDPMYGGGGARRVTGSQRPGATAVERVTHRQALHATALRFAHPETRVWQEFMVDWPDDLRPCLAVASGDDAVLAGESVLDYLGFPALG